MQNWYSLRDKLRTPSKNQIEVFIMNQKLSIQEDNSSIYRELGSKLILILINQKR